MSSVFPVKVLLGELGSFEQVDKNVSLMCEDTIVPVLVYIWSYSFSVVYVYVRRDLSEGARVSQLIPDLVVGSLMAGRPWAAPPPL